MDYSIFIDQDKGEKCFFRTFSRKLYLFSIIDKSGSSPTSRPAAKRYITQILAARWVSAINRLDCRQSSENGGVKQDTTALESLPPYPCTVIYSLHHVLLHQFMDVKWGGRLLSRELECAPTREQDSATSASIIPAVRVRVPYRVALPYCVLYASCTAEVPTVRVQYTVI